MKRKPTSRISPDIQAEIRLYEELLECLEQEWAALRKADEGAILALAGQKENLLKELLAKAGAASPAGDASPETRTLLDLKKAVAKAQARNHRLIVSALDTIQEFFHLLKASAPGVYQPNGEMKPIAGNALIHRRA